MGRIVVDTRITNLFDEDKSIRCEMLVDTGAGALILPTAWKDTGSVTFKRSKSVALQLANQDALEGEACWPVEIEIDGFRPVSNEVIFVDMEGGEDDGYEPLLGYRHSGAGPGSRGLGGASPGAGPIHRHEVGPCAFT